MAKIVDSTSVDVSSSSGALSSIDLWIEAIKIIPALSWIILFALVWIVYRKEIRELLFKIDGLEFGKVKISIKRSLDAAIAQGKEQVKDLSVAQKDEKYEVIVPEKDKRKVVTRAQRERKKLENASFLWVDDHPENNNNERRMYQELGVFIDFAESTDSAIELLKNNDYDCVISDMDRTGNSQAGIELIQSMQEKRCFIPVIIYLGVFDPDKGIPLGAFGITNRPDELLHLTLDVMARKS